MSMIVDQPVRIHIIQSFLSRRLSQVKEQPDFDTIWKFILNKFILNNRPAPQRSSHVFLLNQTSCSIALF